MIVLYATWIHLFPRVKRQGSRGSLSCATARGAWTRVWAHRFASAVAWQHSASFLPELLQRRKSRALNLVSYSTSGDWGQALLVGAVLMAGGMARYPWSLLAIASALVDGGNPDRDGSDKL